MCCGGVLWIVLMISSPGVAEFQQWLLRFTSRLQPTDMQLAVAALNASVIGFNPDEEAHLVLSDGNLELRCNEIGLNVIDWVKRRESSMQALRVNRFKSKSLWVTLIDTSVVDSVASLKYVF